MINIFVLVAGGALKLLKDKTEKRAFNFLFPLTYFTGQRLKNGFRIEKSRLRQP